MKVFLIILGSILALLLLLTLLLSLLVKLHLVYDGDISVKVGVLFIRYTLYPKKVKLLNPRKEERKKSKKLRKEAKKAAKKQDKKIQTSKTKKTVKKKKSDLRDMLSLYTDIAREVILPTAEKLGKKLHIYIKKLRVEIGSQDAGKTAVLYGAAVSGGTILLEMLRSAVKLKMGKTEDIAVTCRYDRDSITAEGEIVIALRPLPVAIVLLPMLINYFKMKQEFEYRQNKKNKNEV